jgi:uncharacterized YigZ family protein
MNEFVTISEHDTAEIIEKKSRFIANIFHVENIEQVEEQLNKIKKQHYSARHNCYAYRIIKNDMIIEKSSDDGEPSGTAGAPMLNILSKNNLCNILIVVTRYFGGILLGTGGLARAYSDATLKVIQQAKKEKNCKGYKLEILLEYSSFESFKYYCKNNGINIINSNYNENINTIIELNEESKNKLLEDFQIKAINIKNIKVLSEKYINKSI